MTQVILILREKNQLSFQHLSFYTSPEALSDEIFLQLVQGGIVQFQVVPGGAV